MLPEAKKIKELIEDAQQNWTGWDWSDTFLDRNDNAYYLSSEKDITDDMPDEVIEQAEILARKAEADAKEASAFGDEAIEHIKKNDLEQGIGPIYLAIMVEENWGSSPIWDVPLKAVDDLLEDLELQLDDILDTFSLDTGHEIEYEVVRNNTVKLVGHNTKGKSKRTMNLLVLVDALKKINLKEVSDIMNIKA